MTRFGHIRTPALYTYMCTHARAFMFRASPVYVRRRWLVFYTFYLRSARALPLCVKFFLRRSLARDYCAFFKSCIFFGCAFVSFFPCSRRHSHRRSVVRPAVRLFFLIINRRHGRGVISLRKAQQQLFCRARAALFTRL